MPDTHSAGGWACLRTSELAVHLWPDGVVVFDDADGNLQCLSPTSGLLLEALLDGRARSAEALAQDLLGEMPSPDDVQMVENILNEFSSLNFIERVAV